VNLTLKPALPNTGIIFRRIDLPDSPLTRAIIANVTDGKLATTIGNNETGVNTVEHLLAALTGLGIDNVIIELDAPEIPILDGSAQPFVNLLKAARLKYQNVPKKFVVIKEPIIFKCEDKYIEAYPADRLTIDCTIDFGHPVIKKQSLIWTFSYKGFVKEISPSRTFCLREDIETLWANGFAQGGSLQNAVVVDKNGVVNEEGLRFPNEFVRHKILDLLGDFSLLGHPIIGYIKTYKTGHILNHRFLKKLLSEPKKWELTKIISNQKGFIFQKVYYSPFLSSHYSSY
ncbi:MAG: UDP-3-O-acyl-N-acetylglucosamine deacetylase, partial [Desulfobacterota bacterium]|nr:UDP-3-O-acyl-N-acetylglucosamine deacetylase [Thermodesulfobacteriota bacterium]